MREILAEVLKLCKATGNKFFHFLKWVALAGIIGAVVGVIGTIFSYGMKYATMARTARPMLIFGLPIGGLVIVYMYHLAHRDNDKGTNSILSAIRSEEELSVVMAPLIFVSTIITHLFGGSAGREGAALQIGGSIGSWFAKIFRMDEKDKHVMIMCGMSACFAALFRTPLAAAIFPMEVVSVGIMYYSALVPCAFASLIASEIAKYFGVGSEAMTIALIPEFTAANAGKIVVLAILFAVLSVVFCVVLHDTAHIGKKLIPNSYIRILAASFIIIILTKILNTTDYMGAGMDIIERSVEGEVRPEAFILKIVFTALTLGAGFKGGEIVPSFFVGATFGCLMGSVFGISPSMCAAVGMISVFCGVTNSPISSLLIALELFGMEAFPFFLVGISVSYMLSGHHSLYNAQKIVYSKIKAEFLENNEK